MFPSTSSRETLRFSGNKIHCSPRDQSLSVKCWSQLEIKILVYFASSERQLISFLTISTRLVVWPKRQRRSVSGLWYTEVCVVVLYRKLTKALIEGPYFRKARFFSWKKKRFVKLLSRSPPTGLSARYPVKTWVNDAVTIPVKHWVFRA